MKPFSSSAALVVFFLASTFITNSSSAQVLYRLSDIGDLPGGDEWNWGGAINDFGEVAGASVTESGPTNEFTRVRPYHWSESTGITEIPAPLDSQYAYGTGINSDGLISIYSRSLRGRANRGWIWNPSVSERVEIQPIVAGNSIDIESINDFGWVTGTESSIGYRWDPVNGIEHLSDLGRQPTETRAINNVGQIAGSSVLLEGFQRAFILDPGSTQLQNIGIPPGNSSSSRAFGLNDLGDVVGYTRTPFGNNDTLYESFFWNETEGFTVLGQVPGIASGSSGAKGVNNRGFVTGWGGDYNVGWAGFVYSPYFGVQNLLDVVDSSGAGYDFIEAPDINEFGQILARGVDPDGNYSAMVLTPVTAGPESFVLARGVVQGGSLYDITFSDDTDLTISRNRQDLQPVIEFEVQSIVATPTPQTLTFTIESSVNSRGQVTQTIELFDYESGKYEQIDSRAASRFNDSVVSIPVPGDASRFVQAGLQSVRARISYSATRSSADYSARVDRITWGF